MHLTYRQTCRVCGSKFLKPVIDLGDQYLQGAFIKPGTRKPPMRKLPTELVRCDISQDENACGLLQTRHSVPPTVLYSNYWYRSGTNATMRNHLKSIADSAVGILGAESQLTVLDIGCNDGTLLRSYPENYTKYGCDPSDIAREIEAPITVVNTVFPSEKAMATFGDVEFDVVTSIAMFYDLESPLDFARSIRKVLGPKGVWIFEMSYLPLMLKTNSFDTICHEHLEYYSLSVLEYILRESGMRLFRHDINGINGGSIRCYTTPIDNFDYDTVEASEAIMELRLEEFDLELDTDKPYVEFQHNIERVRNDLQKLLNEAKSEGKKVHIYGASTKGNTLLQWMGIDTRLVECASDRNPDKDGAFTLGTDIPIVSEEKSRAMKPDYYLVLPWHFKDEFVEREKETIIAGTKMIFPLPELEVIDKSYFKK